MPATAVHHVTFEEFEAMPEQPGKQELLRGELIELPPAKKRHNRIAKRVVQALASAINEPSEGEVFQEMGFRFASGSWLVPTSALPIRTSLGTTTIPTRRHWRLRSCLKVIPRRTS